MLRTQIPTDFVDATGKLGESRACSTARRANEGDGARGRDSEGERHKFAGRCGMRRGSLEKPEPGRRGKDGNRARKETERQLCHARLDLDSATLHTFTSHHEAASKLLRHLPVKDMLKVYTTSCGRTRCSWRRAGLWPVGLGCWHAVRYVLMFSHLDARRINTENGILA